MATTSCEPELALEYIAEQTGRAATHVLFKIAAIGGCDTRTRSSSSISSSSNRAAAAAAAAAACNRTTTCSGSRRCRSHVCFNNCSCCLAAQCNFPGGVEQATRAACLRKMSCRILLPLCRGFASRQKTTAAAAAAAAAVALGRLFATFCNTTWLL